MAYLRIRWRREGSDVPEPAAAVRTPSALGLGFFVWAAALSLVVLALAARVYNVNWDNSGHLHPDERHITSVAASLRVPSSVGEYFDTSRSRLNPYNLPNTSFVYGTFPLFLTKGIAHVLDEEDYDSIVLVGRHLSAIFDAGSVLLVFLIARRLYGPLAGLFGAALMATAPLAIQHAHFFVFDSFLTFFMAASVYFLVRIVQEGRFSDYAFAGLLIGLGTATKLTALVLLPLLGLAVLIRLWPLLVEAWRSGRLPLRSTYLRRGLIGLALALLVGFLAFRVAQPYAFQKPRLSDLAVWTIDLNKRFVDDQKQQSRLLGGDAFFPPSVQWIGRESYLFPLHQMVRWGMAPAFGIVGWAGLAYACYRFLRFREVRHLVVIAFVLAYFGFMGRQFSLYLRYFLPLYPALAVLGGYLLSEVIRTTAALAVRRSRPAFAYAGQGFAAAVLVLSLFFGLAYLSVYSAPVTRQEANRWFFANIPQGKSVAVEHWDDRVPGYAEDRYRIFDLPLYEPDTPEKVKLVIDRLSDADYVVMSSNRLMNSIPRHPITYPVSARYYDLMLDEQLGFRLRRSFTSYPRLFGIEFPDHATEESWSSYDHPRVLIFEKTPAFSRARLEQTLGSGPFVHAVIPPGQAGKNGLLLSAGDLETQRRGGTWTDVFATGGIAVSNPTLLWLVALQLSAFAVAPLTMLLFRRLPDRGYLLSKPLGLMLLAYPVWLLVSLKLVPYTQTTILLWLLLLLATGAAAFAWRRGEMLAALRRNWRLILFAEALFLVAFLFAYELRLLNPDLWHPHRGGEKPMDLAYLTAVTRSTTLPPYDPWFAGGYINYYYLGQFFTATLSKLTMIRPELAFNLGVPTFYALTVAAAFSISYNLAGTARNLLRRRPSSAGGGRFRPISSGSVLAAGILGAVFVALAGNLDGFGQLSDRLSAVSSWHFESSLPLLPGLINSLGGLVQVVFNGADLREFDFWRPSRMMPPTISITEFPYWSFLFADLHAHVMSIPFDLLAIAGSMGLALGRWQQSSRWREWALIALLALIVGSLRALNSWDYPPFLLLGLTAIAIGERRAEGGLARATGRVAAKGALFVGLSFLFFQPFLANYDTPVSGLVSSPETTPLHQYLAHFGLFLFVIGVWLAYQLVRTLRLTPLGRFATADAAALRQRYAEAPALSQVWLSAALGWTLLLATLAFVLVQRDLPTVAFLAPVLLLVFYLALREFRRPRADGALRLFLLALLALALGLSIGVEVVTINGDIQRMNTVFKFYIHIWLLCALISAFAVWYLGTMLLGAPRAVRTPSLRAARSAAAATLAVLVLGALVYPAFATPPRLRDRFVALPRTLDGTAFMAKTVYQDPKGQIPLFDDRRGIEWLRENVEGTPAIVEGRTDLYRWGGRFSIYTGLPTVLGWDWHQTQQRGKLAGMVSQRAEQVDAFYKDPNPDQALRFLRRYDVRYVIVGQVERLYYPGAGLQKFQSGLNGALEVAYENPSLTIYRVRPAALGAVASP